MAITNFIPTVWSENLYQALDKQYIGVANCNREFEGDIREKGSIVRICGLGDITVSDYKKNIDMSSPEALSDNVRNLEINRAKYFNFQIDDIDRAQATPRLMDLAMKKAANALANEADRFVYELCMDAEYLVEDFNLTSDKIIDHFIEARTLLYKNNVSDPNDIVFEVTPEIAALILKAKINLNADGGNILETGCIGSIGGCKIFVSNNVLKEEIDDQIVHMCIARTKRSVAFAEQLSEIDAYRPELRFADAVKGLHLYGAKVIYPQEMVRLAFTIQK